MQQNSVPRYVATAIAMGCAAAAAVAPSHAQQQGARADETDLSEVVVTARKREESLLEVPISITALTADALQENGITDITQVATLTPGFAMQNNSRNNDQPFFRGMSVNSLFRDQQLASSFIDGVFVQGLARTVDLNTEVERVEVIRGPQSALFGRSTFSGAINYVTKKPTNDWSGRLFVKAGENGRADLSANVGGPIVDGKLQFRANLRLQDYDGAFRNSTDGLPVGSEKTEGGSLALRFTPTDSLEILLRGSATKLEDGHPPNVILPATINNCSNGGLRRYYCGTLPIPSQVSLNLASVNGGYRNTDQKRSYLQVNWDLGDYLVTSNTSYNDEQFDYFIDGDGTSVAVLGGLLHSRFIEDFRDKAQELRVESQGEGRLKWLAGLNYFDGDYEIYQLRPTVSVPNTSNSVNRAVFVSGTWEFSDRWGLGVDARYQRDEVRVINPAGVTILAATTNNFLPRVILDFKPVDGSMYFLSAAKGSRPATFNSNSQTPPQFRTVDEQQIWSYELGGKWRLFDGRATLAATAFFIDWDDQTTQLQVVGLNGSPLVIVQNIGQTQIPGLELELSTRITENWNVRATLARVQAEYKKINSTVCRDVYGDITCGGDRELQNTPKLTVSLASYYQREVANGWDWFFNGDVSYRSAMYVAEVNLAKNPAATVANLRTGFEKGPWNLALFVDNVTNEDAPAFATRTSDFGTSTANGGPYGYQLALRKPREWGVTASYRF
jgi:iron complex outermembrane receptor protein